jgi:hypothetical protein
MCMPGAMPAALLSPVLAAHKWCRAAGSTTAACKWQTGSLLRADVHTAQVLCSARAAAKAASSHPGQNECAVAGGCLLNPPNHLRGTSGPMSLEPVFTYGPRMIWLLDSAWSACCCSGNASQPS